jgi:dihydrofolate reductase
MIVAMDRNRGIGIGNKLPCRLKADVDHFKHTTINGGNGIVNMGRKTWCSIPIKFRPLEGRLNVIITRNPESVVPFHPNIIVAGSINEALWICRGKRFFVMGGEEIYKQFMPLADRLVITHIDAVIHGCDRFFPEIDESWEHHRTLFTHGVDEDNKFPFKVVEYTRRPRIL